MSFLTDKIIEDALTFDDVLLIPAYSEVIGKDVLLTSQFSRNIIVKSPIISAAMDTVTEAIMAIAMAREGGIGVLHKNMSIEAQAKEVVIVKRSENGMIKDPVTIFSNATVADVLKLMKDFKIGGIPVVDENKKLIGIVTNRDLRFEKDVTRPISEVMTKDRLVTTKEFTTLEEAEQILQKYKIEKLPVVDKNNFLTGLITLKDITKVKTHPISCKDKQGRLRVAAAIGVAADTIDRASALVDAGVDALIIDTAHGHSKNVVETLKRIKQRFPDVDVIAGNIATSDAAKLLASAGADGLKVGIGPGSICTTRIIAGIGVPQLSAIYNVAQAVKGLNIPVIADGGIRYSGDLVKAIACGASTVMLGSILAGVDESPSETILYEGRKFKLFRGMGSIDAMQKGSKDRYGQENEDDVEKLVPEGIVGRVPYKGTLSEVVYQLLGGLRAGMGYCGAKTIDELKDAKFVRISAAGIQESHPHDVTIIRESPNYSR